MNNPGFSPCDANRGHELEPCLARFVDLLTGSRSGEQRDRESQAQAGDMSRYHRRSPQPHVEPEFPHPQPLSHRTVLGVGPHPAEPPLRLPGGNSARTRCTVKEIGGSRDVNKLRELHNHSASSQYGHIRKQAPSSYKLYFRYVVATRCTCRVLRCTEYSNSTPSKNWIFLERVFFTT